MNAGAGAIGGASQGKGKKEHHRVEAGRTFLGLITFTSVVLPLLSKPTTKMRTSCLITPKAFASFLKSPMFHAEGFRARFEGTPFENAQHTDTS